MDNTGNIEGNPLAIAGLGPNFDDLTKQAVELRLSLENLKEEFPEVNKALSKMITQVKRSVKRIGDIKIPTPKANKRQKNESVPAPKSSFFDSIKDYVTRATTAVPEFFKNILPTKKAPKEDSDVKATGSIDDRKLTKEGVQPVIAMFGGITQTGVRNLKEKLPEIVKDLIKKVPELKEFFKSKDTTTDKKGYGGGLLGLLKGLGIGSLLLAGGGIALILGGLAALIKGLETDGPFKGLLKILSKVGIEGGLKLLEKNAVKALNALKGLIMYPVKLLRRVAVSIAGIFGRGGLRTLSNLKKTAGDIFKDVIERISGAVMGLVTRAKNLVMAPIRFIGRIASNIGSAIMGLFSKGGPAGGVGRLASSLGGGLSSLFGPIVRRIGNFLKPLLKKIPIVGTAISLAFAFSRFKKGDWVGGLIDVASAIAALVPGVGTVLSLAIDAFGAFLDLKAGGADAKASAKKSGMITGWVKSLGKWVFDKVKDLPIIGSLINTVYHIAKGKWKEALISFGHIVPGIGLVLDLFGVQETDTQGVKKDNMLTNWVKGLQEWLMANIEKIPFLNSLYRSIAHFSAGQWAEGFKSLGHAIPLIDTILSFFNIKETDTDGKVVEDSNLKQTFDLIGKLKDWVYDNIIGKISGWITSIYEWGKDKVKALADTVSGWFGGKDETPPPPDTPKPPKAPKPTGTQAPNATDTTGTEDNTTDETTDEGSSAPQAKDTAKGVKAIDQTVAKAVAPAAPPGTATGEETAASVTYNKEGTDNGLLKDIASNTGTTSDAISTLNQSILRLIKIMDSKQMNGGSVIINGQPQQQNQPSASMIAANNADPIKKVRDKFNY